MKDKGHHGIEPIILNLGILFPKHVHHKVPQYVLFSDQYLMFY